MIALDILSSFKNRSGNHFVPFFPSKYVRPRSVCKQFFVIVAARNTIYQNIEFVTNSESGRAEVL